MQGVRLLVLGRVPKVCSQAFPSARDTAGFEGGQRRLTAGRLHSSLQHCSAEPPHGLNLVAAATLPADECSGPPRLEADLGNDRARWHPKEAYPSLDFAELYGHTGRVRIRQHVNPLKKELQKPAEPPIWHEVFADPTLPLCVDIGSGGGRFLLELSKQMPWLNCLGLEIRRPLVERGNTWGQAVGASSRVHFLLANATVSLQHLLTGPRPYPASVDLVTILHPDPHWKTRLRKRRVVQPSLVSQLASILKPGAKVVMQSDDIGIAEAMRTCFEQHGLNHFHPADPAVHSRDSAFASGASVSSSWGQSLPFASSWALQGWHEWCLPALSDREVLCQQQGLPIYRTVLYRADDSEQGVPRD